MTSQVNQLTDAGSEHKLSFWLCQLGVGEHHDLPSAAPVPRARILKTRYESRRVTGPCSAATASTAKRARLLPTPDTGTSPRGHARRAGQLGNGHQSGQGLVAVAMALHPPPAAGRTARSGKALLAAPTPYPATRLAGSHPLPRPVGAGVTA